MFSSRNKFDGDHGFLFPGMFFCLTSLVVYFEYFSLVQNFDIFYFVMYDIYWITAVFEGQDRHYASIPASLIGRAVIMYVKIFKTYVICDIMMHFTSQWPVFFSQDSHYRLYDSESNNMTVSDTSDIVCRDI